MIQKDEIIVTAVDREQHTIYLTVRGCPVIAMCAPDNNPDIYERVKEILIGAVSRVPIRAAEI